MRFILSLALLTLCLSAQATPLHEAARTGNLNQVRSQLAAGAAVNATDRYGFTPLLLAQLNGHRQTAALLETNGAQDGLQPLVEQIQRQLRAVGHDPGAIDGALGPATRNAIRAYQRQIGEPVTGRVRESWVRRLHDQVNPPAAARTATADETTRVRRLQASLSVLGHDTGGADGLIGPTTRNAIRRFQQQQNIRVDGQVSDALYQQVDRALTRSIQQQLTERGLQPGPIDGIAGDNTRRAIEAFERQQGLSVTGQISPSLAQQLAGAQRRTPPAQPALTPAPQPSPTTTTTTTTTTNAIALAAIADQSARNRRLQASLTVLGHDTGGVDGAIGPATRNAIRRFQQQEGMRADGHVSVALYNRIDQALTRHIQQRLLQLGFDPGPVDGVAGENTRMAIQAFERQQGLNLTGQISPALAARLAAVSRQPEPQTTVTAPPLTDRESVRAAQTHLRSLGLNPGAIDGALGPNTRNALRRYQAQRGLTETGELTTSLLARLAADAGSDATAVPRDHELIREIQSRLNSLGYNTGSADGEYGPRTAAAIRRFERHLGLPAEGEPSRALLETLRTTPLAAAQAPPAQGQATSSGNTEVHGPLLMQHSANNELIGCSISGVQLDRSWCEPFENHPSTRDCQALLRPDARVIMVRCN